MLAMAGPTWERRPQPLFEQNLSRVILFDLSLSMNSSDLQPSRLQQAKFQLIDLIQSAKNQQQALIVFAGDGFIVAPFTNDAETLVNLVPGLDVNTVPVQGSRVDKALLLAAELIRNAEVRSAELVLIADGADPNSVLIAKQLADAGHRLHVLGVGTRQGAPILLGDGSLLKDQNGNIVIPSLDQAHLSTLAAAGGGTYANIGLDDQQIQRLNAVDESVENLVSAANATSLVGDSWVDAGTLFLLPLLLLASLGFRRGWLLMIVFLVSPLPDEAYAFEWRDLWLTPNQQAAQAMNSKGNIQVPSDASTRWQAAAAFRQKQYEEALTSYNEITSRKGVSATDFYNLGNAQAKSGQLQKALESYEQSLELDPKLQDAIYNRNIVRQLLEDQEQKKGESPQAQSDQQNQEQQPGEEESEQDNQGKGQQSPENGEMQEAQNQQQEQRQANSAEKQVSDIEEDMEQGEGEQEENSSADEPQQVAQLEQKENMSGDSLSEEEQALEQWLKKIPDDPGGLLKRKFLYQYRLRDDSAVEQNPW
ncbi:MAG: VWA domain-containing protein [Acidiferrobacterales bacterium]|nr:VWA domain-containing protein [Acidiferrobacterales bacterium]